MRPSRAQNHLLSGIFSTRLADPEMLVLKRATEQRLFDPLCDGPRDGPFPHLNESLTERRPWDLRDPRDVFQRSSFTE